jgi:glycerol-3-phosphate cytidylyltransferase
MRNGKKVGITASAFDLFHAGHIIMLQEAKEVCDYLIAAMQTDPTIDRPEKNKPVQSVFERYVQLQACRYIDEIVVYATEKDLRDILLSYPIDIRILGEEYQGKQFTGYDIQMEFHFNKRQHSFSTTELRQRIITLEHQKQEAAKVVKADTYAGPASITLTQNVT